MAVGSGDAGAVQVVDLLLQGLHRPGGWAGQDEGGDAAEEVQGIDDTGSHGFLDDVLSCGMSSKSLESLQRSVTPVRRGRLPGPGEGGFARELAQPSARHAPEEALDVESLMRTILMPEPQLMSPSISGSRSPDRSAALGGGRWATCVPDVRRTTALSDLSLDAGSPRGAGTSVALLSGGLFAYDVSPAGCDSPLSSPGRGRGAAPLGALAEPLRTGGQPAPHAAVPPIGPALQELLQLSLERILEHGDGGRASPTLSGGFSCTGGSLPSWPRGFADTARSVRSSASSRRCRSPTFGAVPHAFGRGATSAAGCTARPGGPAVGGDRGLSGPPVGRPWGAAAAGAGATVGIAPACLGSGIGVDDASGLGWNEDASGSDASSPAPVAPGSRLGEPTTAAVAAARFGAGSFGSSSAASSSASSSVASPDEGPSMASAADEDDESSAVGLDGSMGASSSAGQSAWAMSDATLAELDHGGVDDGVDSGIVVGLLERVAGDGGPLDEGLAIAIRRMLQVGSVLAGERLSDDEIQALPKVHFEDSDQQSCPICLESYRRGEVLTSLHCNHFFHVDCLAGWLQHSMQCPLCRCSVEQPE